MFITEPMLKLKMVSDIEDIIVVSILIIIEWLIDMLCNDLVIHNTLLHINKIMHQTHKPDKMSLLSLYLDAGSEHREAVR